MNSNYPPAAMSRQRL